MLKNKKLLFILIFVHMLYFNTARYLLNEFTPNLNTPMKLIILISFELLAFAYYTKDSFLSIIGTSISNFEIESLTLKNFGPIWIIILINLLGIKFDHTLLLLFQFTILAFLISYFEEYLCRGFIIEQLDELSTTKKIIVSSLIFSLLHIPIINFQTILNLIYSTIIPFGFGYLICSVRMKTRSVIPGMIIHFLYNLVIFLKTGVVKTSKIITINHIFIALAISVFFICYSNIKVLSKSSNQ